MVSVRRRSGDDRGDVGEGGGVVDGNSGVGSNTRHGGGSFCSGDGSGGGG